MLSNLKSKMAVVIANGAYPTHVIPAGIVENATYIVCCDGAANNLIARGIIPNAIVGDLDSLSDENKVRFSDIIVEIKEQESNDLTKAVSYCVEHGITHISIVAATGMREDHLLGNVSLLVDYKKQVTVKMYTDYGVFTPISSSTNFESFEGQPVSIFSLSSVPVSVSGLKYPLHNRILTNWWQGTLNKSLGNIFQVETQGDILVFQVYEKCN